MRYIFILLSFIVSFNCFAQQYDNSWLLTNQYGLYSEKLTFFPSLVTDTIARNMPISRTTLTMSDSLGNLLFYSNGIKIHNSQYQLMQNGDSLNPGQTANNFRNIGYPFIESIISIPHPNQTNKYYIFHQGVTSTSALAGFADKLYYTLVDMNANGGLGKVEIKNQVLLENDSMCGGQLEVVKHGNGRDWWLIQPMSLTNGYHVFLVSNNTVAYHHKQYIGNVRLYSTESIGQAIFSHAGDKYFRYDYRNDFDIYDFDRCSGYFSNYLHIPIVDSVDNVINGSFYTGVAVAPNDSFVYLSSYIYMYQFDLFASNIAASKDTVAVFDNYMIGNYGTIFSLVQSAPDGKIYSLVSSAPYLHVINNPNIRGSGCNVVQRGLDLHYSNTFLPNMPHYRTPRLSGSACDTLTNVAAIPSQSNKKEALLLYPNPANTSVQIETNSNIKQVVLYDALGRAVLRKLVGKAAVVSLYIGSLENGAYVVQVVLESGELLKELLVVFRE